MNDELSTKMRAYLAEIYNLADSEADANGYISTSTVADILNVSAPAVNRMVNRLKELGMLLHEPYQGIKLTPDGEREALKQLRSQRITESFLVKVMGFQWDDIHEDAQQISSAAGETILTRMAEMAGNPTHSPHGEPIPSLEGTLPATNDKPLSSTEAGDTVIVTRLRTREADRLNYIAALGLIPGVQFDVLHIAPFSGPMQLKVGDEYRIIGHNLAELIYVRS
ncbi:metal-dependent transcriptional regulator [Phototrophicus methaneseepsis]|uniref:Manganese transport regulator n=1 Tax=Phototrophicus methaneseepsis TaxID=2710758 RepID=A0A7S8EBH7_9CHLR|nr:metal-dependent transcriptional regulator [Phototrophicus methaneseepsis]QPC83809.1 metal-dependent transcriptional regulator [Phototrophicus methaneseepsis]